MGSSNHVPGLGPWRHQPPPANFEPFPDEALDDSVGARFLAVAEQFGDHTALRSPDGSWTFGQLRSDVLARAAAITASVQRDEPTPVAVLATHGGDLVVTMLSVVLAGHVVVVVDPMAPVDQTRHVLVESRATLLLHDLAHQDLATELVTATDGRPRVDVTALALVTLDERGSDRPFEVPQRGPSDPLMLAFTSGTSGDSKAAVVTHGVIMNLVRGATNALGITSADRMPMLFPVSLAVAAYPMFLPLLNGGTLSTLDVRGVGLAPMADFLEEERITLAYMAPTVVRFLVDALAGRSFPDLRMIALGGELVDAEVVQLTEDLFAPRHVANGFGTTETGVITLYVMEPGEKFDGAAPAGYPVPDVELMILDDEGKPVHTGEAGEVAIVTPFAFDGYWGHAELNAQVLSADPNGRDGWRLYRTGDLGRIDVDGALTVLGRLDTKVKVRGRFVVLGDVESDLHAIDAVQDAAVTAIVRDGVTELGAVVTGGTHQITTADLRAELLASREAYRVPSQWMVVDELPRLPNGKLDRQGVHEMFNGSSVSSTSEAAPPPGVASTDSVVRELRDLWELLLPVEVVGLDDDFQHLGGDSLLAAQMLVHLERRLGVTVPMGALVSARTLRELAEVVTDLQAAGDATPSTAAEVQRGSAGRPRLWFVHDLQGSAYRVRHLADALGPDQPVWSFESPLLRGEPNEATSLATFVARYVKDLRRAQPEGPYWLAGYSFGGICAYEIARQLVRDGDEVAFVGVIDVGPGYRGPGWSNSRAPFRPWFGVAKPPADGSTISEQLHHYQAMVKASPTGAARHLMVRSGLAERIDPLRFAADLRRHGRIRPEWRLWYAWEEHWKLAAKAWERTSTYDGPVHLFWADDTASSDASLGWATLVHDLRIERFPGDHEGVLEPRGASGLAAPLRVSLDQAIEARSSADRP